MAKNKNSINVYGIKNCNTVKKALDWMNTNEVTYEFHDFKKEPATAQQLKKWGNFVGWQQLVNKKGTTWRKLSPEEQAAVVNAESAQAVLLKNNSMIKRPIIELEDDVLLGFDEAQYESKLL